MLCFDHNLLARACAARRVVERNDHFRPPSRWESRNLKPDLSCIFDLGFHATNPTVAKALRRRRSPVPATAVPIYEGDRDDAPLSLAREEDEPRRLPARRRRPPRDDEEDPSRGAAAPGRPAVVIAVGGDVLPSHDAVCAEGG